jgi:DNA-binding GntR family transcriptional regulator
MRASRVPYLEIAAEVREQIRSGRLVPGDRLDTVRSLAAHYSVAQGTIGAAMEVLRAEGLIDTVQGKGSVVVSVPGEVPADPGMAKLSAEIAELREMVRDYAELREMVRDHDVMLEDMSQRIPGPYVRQRRGVSEEREREQLG